MRSFRRCKSPETKLLFVSDYDESSNDSIPTLVDDADQVEADQTRNDETQTESFDETL